METALQYANTQLRPTLADCQKAAESSGNWVNGSKSSRVYLKSDKETHLLENVLALYRPRKMADPSTDSRDLFFYVHQFPQLAQMGADGVQLTEDEQIKLIRRRCMMMRYAATAVSKVLAHNTVAQRHA